MWSEPGSVTKAEVSGCTGLRVAVYILLWSLLSLEEESGESGICGGEFLSTCYREIVKSKT